MPRQARTKLFPSSHPMTKRAFSASVTGPRWYSTRAPSGHCAKAIVRGGPSTDPALAGGAFYHPTLLAVPDSESPIVQQETFGPVQTVQVFDTEEEAIALANCTDYGLSACVWSRYADRPCGVARQLDAGLISINSWANLTVEFEEGGFKSSGLGRLGGVASIEDFLEYKQITQNYAPLGAP